MRAFFYCKKDFIANEELTLDEDSTHHLHVARVKVGADVLVLNGHGLKVFTQLMSISKKVSILRVLKVEETFREHALSLAFGVPKKDAFEDIIKTSVELGIANIHPLSTKYSQYTYETNERIQRIVESAMIQSNNTYFHKIHTQVSLEEFVRTNEYQLFFLNSAKEKSQLLIKEEFKYCFLIGPEAGFSFDEVEMMRSNQNVAEIYLPTPILRAPTAVAVAAGYLLNQLN